jgi:hypothetical protein
MKNDESRETEEKAVAIYFTISYSYAPVGTDENNRFVDTGGLKMKITIFWDILTHSLMELSPS